MSHLIRSSSSDECRPLLGNYRRFEEEESSSQKAFEKREFVWRDFNPFSSWEIDKKGPFVSHSLRKMHVIDVGANRPYLNESFKTDLWKCSAVFFTAPIFYTLMIIASIASPIWVLIRSNVAEHTRYPIDEFFAKTFEDFKTHPFRVITRLVMPVILPLGMLIGTLSCNLKNVRKMFSNIERIGYKNSPFMPDFRYDALINTRGQDLYECGRMSEEGGV